MLDGFHVDAGWPTAIGGALLRRGDPLGLALAAQVGLELGKNAEHVEEHLAGSGRGVHGLFGGSETPLVCAGVGVGQIAVDPDCRQSGSTSFTSGSSPHARVILDGTAGPVSGSGFIPACAGNP